MSSYSSVGTGLLDRSSSYYLQELAGSVSDVKLSEGCRRIAQEQSVRENLNNIRIGVRCASVRATRA